MEENDKNNEYCFSPATFNPATIEDECKALEPQTARVCPFEDLFSDQINKDLDLDQTFDDIFCPDPEKLGQKNEDKNTDNQFVEDFLDDVFDDNLLNDFSLSHFSANEPRIFVEEAFSDSLDTSFDQTFDQTSLDMVKRKIDRYGHLRKLKQQPSMLIFVE